MLHREVSYKLTKVSEVLTASVTRAMMEVVSISKIWPVPRRLHGTSSQNTRNFKMFKVEITKNINFHGRKA
jgi:hypothetical protein